MATVFLFVVYNVRMDILSRFRAINEADKANAVSKLIENATPDFDFFYLTVLSVLMASFGLLAGSETVVIGSMLLAPIMSPVLALALGLSMSNQSLMTRSLGTLGRATTIAIVAAAGAALLFSFGSFGSAEVATNSTILSRTEPTLLYFAVAIIAGLAVAYTSARPDLSSNLTGVAVAVALMPPLAAVGIGIAHLNLAIAAGAFVMYLVNIAGIIFAAMLSFSLMDVHSKKAQAESKIVQEERRVEREEEKVAEVINNTSE
jgi:uncharacterized hydrophobic protein (TIGR00271 family)